MESGVLPPLQCAVVTTETRRLSHRYILKALAVCDFCLLLYPWLFQLEPTKSASRALSVQLRVHVVSLCSTYAEWSSAPCCIPGRGEGRSRSNTDSAFSKRYVTLRKSDTNCASAGLGLPADRRECHGRDAPNPHRPIQQPRVETVRLPLEHASWGAWYQPCHS